MKGMVEIVKGWFGVERKAEMMAKFLGKDSGFRSALLGHRAWYRGDAAELQGFYEAYDDGVGNNSFWANKGSNGIGFRKVHSGLPGIMVDKLVDLVCGDLQKIEVERQVDEGCSVFVEGDRKAVWDRISEENGFEGLLRKAVRDVLVCGDGAFKVNVDFGVSQLPLVEFVCGEDLDFVYRSGRLVEVVFRRVVGKVEGVAASGRRSQAHNDGEYLLLERYGFGYVRYELFDGKGRVKELCELEETAGLCDVGFDEGLMMAVPMKFDESGKFFGRGKSLFEGKEGLFDGLDEVISQWIDCLRVGRPNVYIPAMLLPRDPRNGAVLRPNGFDNRYIQTQGDLVEGAENRIEVVQPDIKTGALMDSYVAFLELCLQGIMAPSTLGIEVSRKRDNAEAQREREKATVFTRNRVLEGVRKSVELLVERCLRVWEIMVEEEHCPIGVSVGFGEYANPGFEAQVETVGKAVGFGIMSLEAAMDELYGDSWSDEEKEREVGRLRG